jgi:hypothetical protein
MSYDKVHIINSTAFVASGVVEYPTVFCKNDHYQMSAFASWTAGSRGVCLVTKIKATLNTPDGDIEAEPYTSSGTSYSEFAIIQLAPGKFRVTRNVPADVGPPPPDYVEPTEPQK